MHKKKEGKYKYIAEVRNLCCCYAVVVVDEVFPLVKCRKAKLTGGGTFSTQFHLLRKKAKKGY